MRIIQFFFLIVLLPLHVSAQQNSTLGYHAFVLEYNELMTKQPSSYYSVEIRTLNYLRETDSKPIEEQRSKIIVEKESSFYYQSNEGLMLQNDNIRLNVDTTNKIVYLQKPIKQKPIIDISEIGILDSIYMSVGKVTSAEKTTYIIENKLRSSSFKQFTIDFSVKTNQITKVEIQYWEADYVSEEEDQMILESPKIITYYEPYKVVDRKKIDPRLQVSAWLTDKLELPETLIKAGYTLHDLRVK